MNLNDQNTQQDLETFFRENGYVKLNSHKDLAHELEDIRVLLQQSMALEHALIPPYLTMLYTLDDDMDPRVSEVIHSVVIEEMLHFVLAGNLLNAIGGTPAVNDPHFLPDYPATLPFGIDDLEIQLHPFSQLAVHQAMQVEHPKYVRPEVITSHVCTDMSIGEYYVYIESRLRAAVESFGEKAVFCGDPERQLATEQFCNGSYGELVQVTDLDSAIKALRTICDQGEGSPHNIWRGSDNDVAHYYRFNEIYCERLYTAGDTIASGPTGDALHIPWDKAVKTHSGSKVSDYPEGELRKAVVRFNRRYSELLENLQLALSGRPLKLTPAIMSMASMRDDFRAIVAHPFPGDSEYHAAPTFEYTPPPPPRFQAKSQAVVFANNQATLERLSQAYAAGDLPMALTCLSEQLVWDMTGPVDVPYTGVFYGHEGFSRFWSLMGQTVEFSSEVVEKIFFSENQAMSYGSQQGITRTTRLPYSYDWAIRYEFTDDHRIRLMRNYFNPMKIQAALAGSPQKPRSFINK
ncbi:ferritin-like domain-containing protein [Musicola keenii]|uniref:ferritin-like domain-containing protein n=1 Tax=Musicola keenii TaxID=2884250 RepID=UPI0017864799|nr:ferritin-like domain-containing protein [Musicola keenii]